MLIPGKAEYRLLALDLGAWPHQVYCREAALPFRDVGARQSLNRQPAARLRHREDVVSARRTSEGLRDAGLPDSTTKKPKENIHA